MEDIELENELYEKIRELRQRIYDLEDENTELKAEIDYLKEKQKIREQDIEDNYRRVSISEQVGVYDKDFI